MSVARGSASFSHPEADGGPDSEDICVNENGLQLENIRNLAWNGGEIQRGETSDDFYCEKCDVRFLGAGALHYHRLIGNSDIDVRIHFYCEKCRIDFQDEAELKSHLMESSQHIVCSECSQEFYTVETLELHFKQVHHPPTIHPCPGCDALFTSISAATQHIESGQCPGRLSPADFRNLINYENNPLAKKGLPADILAGTTTTHTWRGGIIPARVKAALADTSGGFKPEELVPKDFVGILDHTLPAESTSSHMGNPRDYWDEMLGAYVCPRPKCRKKFNHVIQLKAHLESNTHDKKSFRCPTCVSCFVSSSALLQHAESETCGVKRSTAYKQLIKGATGGLMDGGKKAEIKTGW